MTFRRQIQTAIAHMAEWDLDEGEARNAVYTIREIGRLAIGAGAFQVAKICSISTPMLAPHAARILLAECLSALTPDLLTVKQAAERLGVCAQTVYALIEKGRLRCQRIGVGRGTIRIRPADLDGCLAEPEPTIYRHLKIS